MNISTELQSKFSNPIHTCMIPYDIDLLYDLFYKDERTESILIGSNRWAPNRGLQETLSFANTINHIYPDLLIESRTNYKEQSDTMLYDWLEYNSRFSFCFNLDGPEQFCGQVGIQCAVLGVIQIGGVTESSEYLFPETSGLDPHKLLPIFSELYNDVDKRNILITKAWSRVNKLYSFPAVKQQILNIYEAH